MVKPSQQVLAVAQVDSSLSANRSIYLCQKGGGYLHVINAAHVNGSQKSNQVAHHSATRGLEDGAAVRTQPDEVAGERFYRRHAFTAGTVGHFEQLRFRAGT